MTNLKEIIQNSFANFYKVLSKNVVNNLNSTSTTLPLSANQGKELNDRIEKLVPIGYIFTWTNKKINGNTLNAPSLTTPDKVKNYFGFGTWERINDRFLYSGSAIGGTGGESTVALSIENMPSHSHSIPSLSGYTGESGNHTHFIRAKYDNNCATKSSGVARANGGGSETSDFRFGDTSEAGNHSHTVTTYASTTGATGSETATHNNMPPYVNVYMWMRVG